MEPIVSKLSLYLGAGGKAIHFSRESGFFHAYALTGDGVLVHDSIQPGGSKTREQKPVNSSRDAAIYVVSAWGCPGEEPAIRESLSALLRN